MKKKLLIIAFVCLAATAFGQTTMSPAAAPEELLDTEDWIKPKPVYGIQAGVNLATIRPLFNDEPKISMHAGLFRSERFARDFGYQVELNYSKQGSSVASEYQEFRLNYLQMPVLLNVYAGDRILVQGGAYGAFLLNASVDQKYTTTQTYKFITNKTNVYEYFETLDAGVCMGLTFSSTYRTQIGVRYNHGLTNINHKIQIKDTGIRPDLHNSVLQFSAGFRFL